MSGLKTFALLTLLTLLLMWAGNALGGQTGMVIALIFATLLNFTSYWFSDKVVLTLYGAKKVERNEAPTLHRMVEELCGEEGLPKPQVCIIPSSAPNAFATGRSPSSAAVAVTEGIMNLLSERELKGVLSHELAHIKNRDTLIATVAATIAGAITMLANMARWAAIFGGFGRDEEERGGVIGMLFMAILAPIAALLIQLAISRQREYAADATGAKLSKDPLSLASALEKLTYAARRIPMNAEPSTAHLFIVNPLTGGGLLTLFSTHPPVEERIRRLRRLAELI